MEAVSCICTLYELGQALANLKNKKRFEELHLGPLCKIPLIHRMFKMDANTKDDDVHQIATVDILRVSLVENGCVFDHPATYLSVYQNTHRTLWFSTGFRVSGCSGEKARHLELTLLIS